MKKFVLGEKLKEEIDGRKVLAAVFHSFNFDPDFFENYLLPLFLPDIPFGDNKIQNTILWKKFQAELPPITVYCDFHAKAQKGIHLDYTVRPIDIPKVKGMKPCFHPKHSYILLEDWTLIVLIGSNNLTEAGWCSNLEGVNFFKFQSAKNFPREFKDDLKRFNRGVRKQFFNEKPFENSMSPADDMLESLFAKIGYTDEIDCRILNSKDFKPSADRSSIGSLIEHLKTEFNNGLDFTKVEIVSPYFPKGINLFQEIKDTSGCEDISFSIPFENTDFVGMDEALFNEVTSSGIHWKAVKGMNEVKGYRFNHSKIYQFLGEEMVFIIVGSINFTNMAWKGIKYGGNYESAVLYQLPVDKFESLLEEYPTTNLSFAGFKEEESHIDDREDAYDLEFIIDWKNPTELEIINRNPEKQRGYIILDELGKIQIDHCRTVRLKDEVRSFFANTPLIKVKPTGLKTFFYYYPIHKNIGSKPLPAHINLNDTELLQLWMDLEGAEDKETTLRIIDRFIDRITDESGDVKNEELDKSSSTLNLMATHLSGLIQLNKKIFTIGHTQKAQKANQVVLEYYLFNDNVDTLIGYQKLLQKMSHDEKLNNGFYWMLLELIDNTFYKKYLESELFDSNNSEVTESLRKGLKSKINELSKVIKSDKISDKHLRWAKKMLLEDVS